MGGDPNVGAPFVNGSYQLPLLDFGPPIPGNMLFYGPGSIDTGFAYSFTIGGGSPGASSGMHGNIVQGKGGSFFGIDLGETLSGWGSGVWGWFTSLFQGNPLLQPQGPYGSLSPGTGNPSVSPDWFFGSGSFGAVGKFLGVAGAGNFSMHGPPFFTPSDVPAIPPVMQHDVRGHNIPRFMVPELESRQLSIGMFFGRGYSVYDSFFPYNFDLPFGVDRGALPLTGGLGDPSEDNALRFGFWPSGPGRFPAQPPGFAATAPDPDVFGPGSQRRDTFYGGTGDDPAMREVEMRREWQELMRFIYGI